MMKIIKICLMLILGTNVVATAINSGFSDDFIKKAAKKNRLNISVLKKFLPYIYPSINEPVWNTIDFKRVPKELGNTKLAKIGVVDVTAKPFFADPTGKKDSTQAIQKAVDYARDYQMVTYFPAGIYKVTQTINCVQNLSIRNNYTLQGARQFPNVLLGSTKNPQQRAVIYLAENSKGFNNPLKRKYVIRFENRTWLKARMKKYGPDFPQANISYNQIFANIDIKIGRGNAGAFGLRMQAAEGSSIQDVTIDATYGMGGLHGLAGSGGSHHNITVIGGQIGIDSRGAAPEFSLSRTGSQPTPTLTHITLLNQTKWAIINRSRGPLIIVGAKIVSELSGPIIINDKGSKMRPTLNGSLAMIDSTIIFNKKSSNNRVISTNRSLYLKNLYIKNGGSIVKNIKANPAGWIAVKELAYTISPGIINGQNITEPIYIDNKKVSSPYFRYKLNVAPPANLRSKHIWDNKTFPYWDQANVVNVKAAPYNAKGDGIADDTAAIQAAINAHEKVFLPKGIYNISSTLKLKPDTKLIGLAQHLSLLYVKDIGKSFPDNGQAQPIIATANTRTATTVLASLGILVTFDVKNNYRGNKLGLYALKWQCGGKSYLRTLQISPWRRYGFNTKHNTKQLKFSQPLVLVTNHGGGNWYNFYIHGAFRQLKEYRHIAIRNNSGPLRFYQFHAQHSSADFQADIIDSNNIYFYGCKTELDTSFMLIKNSENIEIFGTGGLSKPKRHFALYIFDNCKNFLITNFNDQPQYKATRIVDKGWRKYYYWNIKEYNSFWVIINGITTKIPALERALLYKLGNPQ